MSVSCNGSFFVLRNADGIEIAWFKSLLSLINYMDLINRLDAK